MNGINRIVLLALVAIPLTARFACTGGTQNSFADSDGIDSTSPMKEITSIEEFNEVIENGDDRLLVFDLYANWCAPCRVLNPMLDEIAREHKNKVDFFIINTDDLPEIPAALGVTGIPYVIFVKNQETVYAMMGVQPKEVYVEIIKEYSGKKSPEPEIIPEPQERTIERIRVFKPDSQFDKRGRISPLFVTKYITSTFSDSPVVILCNSNR